MSFFKKLFSKNKKDEPSKASDDSVDKLETSEEVVSFGLDFGDSIPFPYFMRFENHELEEGQLASVFHYSQDQKPVVLQAITLQDEQGLALLDTSDMSEEMLDEIDKQVLANIDDYELEFKFHSEYEEKIIVAQGPMFTCESILSEAQMLNAHAMLDAEEIMIAIPRRGVMLVASNDLPDEMRQKFLGLHMYIWNDENEDKLSQISKDIFVLKNGQIEGVLYLDD